MSFTFLPIEDKQAWEQYVLTRPETNFLHSFNWGSSQQSLGKTVFRLGIWRDSQQVGAMLAVKEEAKRGNYLAIAGGPLLDWAELNEKKLREIFGELNKLARREKCLFIRFRPQALDTPALRNQLKELGIRPAPMHLTADLTLELDLGKSTEELLAEMRKNTRYEVRQAEKKNITVSTTQDPTAIKEFYDHQLALAEKHGFVPFGLKFLQQQFEIFAKDNQAVLFSSYQDNTLLASAYVLFYNREAIYHYGISTPENDRLPGSYACQWVAIQEAQQRGCTHYNFWGIAPKEETDHRFAGVSTFKRGFGGEEVAYLPAHDLPVSPLYWITYFFESLRRKARHL